MNNESQKTIVTHSGGYHADDVFACAALSIFLEKNSTLFKITRSRDESVITAADYVVDVGSQYNAEDNRFDHHQAGGAGERTNEVPYAAFGLVWKKFGQQIAGDEEVARRIDQKLVQPIDAIDNGVNISKDLISDIHPYGIHNVLSTFAPSWEEANSVDDAFKKAVFFAKDILIREIAIVGANTRADQIIQDYYNKSENKSIIVIDVHIFERGTLTANMTEHSDVMLIVYKHRSGAWHVTTARDQMDSFESRILLPEDWAGLQNEELQETSGVTDATFCHQKRFLCGAHSLDGALALANMALENQGK